LQTPAIRFATDRTGDMPHLAEDVAKLRTQSAWLDGEVAVLGANGLPEFNSLQNPAYWRIRGHAGCYRRPETARKLAMRANDSTSLGSTSAVAPGFAK